MTGNDKTTTQDPGEEGLDFMSGDVEKAPPSENTLERLSALAEIAQNLTDEINQDSQETDKKSKELANIVRVLIPNIMDSLEMKDYTMMNGVKISVENKVQASISKKNQDAAFAWLKRYRLDGIIKTVIVSEFGKEKYDDAKKAFALLKEQGVDAELISSIHAGTLKSFVKERLAAEEELKETVRVPTRETIVTTREEEWKDLVFDDTNSIEMNLETIPPIPQDIFGVFVFKEAKIVVPKSK
jgi:hypothetical protein